MAKLSESNKHLKTQAKRSEIVRKGTIQSNAIEGIATDAKTLTDKELKQTLKRAGLSA